MNKKNWIILSGLLVFCITSCIKDDEKFLVNTKTGISLSNIIAFQSVSANSVTADSISVSTINIKVNANSDSAKRYVVYHTNFGKFTNNDTTMTIFASSEGVGSASLLSNTPGQAIVTCSVGGIAIDTTITFTPSLPTSIQLYIDSAIRFPIDSATSLPIAGVLSRPMNGKVSNNLFVYFSVHRSDTIKGQNLIVPPYALSNYGKVVTRVTNPYVTHGNFVLSAFVVSSIDSISGKADTFSQSVYILVR